jgi:hypothetical protein
MENNTQVNKKLTEHQKTFFRNLSIYINEPIYFYGSILRNDYIAGKSDVDVDIFSDDENKTILLLCSFLNISRDEFHKTIYKIKSNIVHGHKLKYVHGDINVEMSIYNNKYKSLVMEDHQSDAFLPLHISILLIIIKFLYYNLNIIPNKIYKRCKQFLMNDNDELKFIMFD